MFKLLTLSTLVALARSFQLEAVAIDDGAATGLVTYDDTGLNFGGGQVADVTLEQPTGFASVNGKYLVVNTDQIQFVDDISGASRDWGVVDGKFRFGPSSDQTWFYSCDDNKVLSRIGLEGCLKLELNVVGDGGDDDGDVSSSVSSDTVTTVSSYNPCPTGGCSFSETMCTFGKPCYSNTTTTNTDTKTTTITTCEPGKPCHTDTNTKTHTDTHTITTCEPGKPCHTKPPVITLTVTNDHTVTITETIDHGGQDTVTITADCQKETVTVIQDCVRETLTITHAVTTCPTSTTNEPGPTEPPQVTTAENNGNKLVKRLGAIGMAGIALVV